jgi:hypothetical protein
MCSITDEYGAAFDPGGKCVHVAQLPQASIHATAMGRLVSRT